MAFRDPRGAKCAWTRTASAARLMAILESCFEPLVSGDQKSLASLSPQLFPFRHIEVSLAWGPSLFFGVSGT